MNIYSNITHTLKIDDDNLFHNYIYQELLSVIQDNIGHDYLACAINHPPCITDWHFGKCSPDSFWNDKHYNGPCVPWADGGCSYILSKHAHSFIIQITNPNNLNTIGNLHIYEDMFIGIVLHNNNIFPKLVKIPSIIGDKGFF